MDTEFFDEDALYRWEFKNKGYAHFDAEFCKSRVEGLLVELKKSERISHRFYPFIRFEIPKFKRDENGRVYKDKDKPRYIMHTARIDSNIYSFYRNVLMNNYDSLLKEAGIDNCVIAYRKILVDGSETKGKCNVHFANEAIEEIKDQTQNNGSCSAIALDISGFFDNLDHSLIKQQWCQVMKFNQGLPIDHFTIFKNITRFKYIAAEKLESKLRMKFSKLRKERIKQICRPDVFKSKVLPHLSEQNRLGIPQGTTISDVIANMYMLDFDKLMKKFANKYGGYYRRYSDDILVVLPCKYQSKALQFVPWLVKRICKLNISDKKTLVSQFQKKNDGIDCVTYKNKGAMLEVIGKPFEYLGLSFDGKRKRIRQSTISAFYDKLSERIKVEVGIAHSKLLQKGIKSPAEDEIYKIISFDMVRNSYMENREEDKDDDFLGNFYTYVQLVSRVTDNSQVINLYDGLGTWIKERAQKYCADTVKRHQAKVVAA